MMLTAEMELAGLILAFYVQDAALLLHSNEGVFTSSGKGAWKLSLGATHARIMGKNLYIPNVLTVHRPHYRMRWNFEIETPHAEPIATYGGNVSLAEHAMSKAVKQSQDQSAPGTLLSTALRNWTPHLEDFDSLGKLTMILGFLQLVAFPTAMFLYQTDISISVVLIAIYATIFLTLWTVWTKAAVFGLAGKKFATLCFECLLCPPLSINLVRRLSLDMCKSADLVAVAEALMELKPWKSARQELCLRIEDQMSLEPEDSTRYAAMKRRLNLLSPDAKELR